MSQNTNPVPPAPELCAMRVDGEALLLDVEDGRLHRQIGIVYNTDLGRRLAACWNKFIPMPTSMIERMPGTVMEMGLAMGASEEADAAPAIDPATLTQDERSVMLYAETTMIDQGGLMQGCRLNEADHAALEKFKALGILDYGRIPFHTIEELLQPPGGVTMRYTHWVTFHEGAWSLAHALRRERALRAERVRTNRKKVDAALAVRLGDK